jgi:2-pyrone-4,6-dicarboxylate lactonase
MDNNYRAFHASPSKPAFTPPADAVDAHCHVFGPAERFPYAKARKYTPSDAPKEKLFALRDHLGFSRNVIVQASCHGTNNDAMVDALLAAGEQARGVAVVDADISMNALHTLHHAGVRAVRFNFVKRLVDATPKHVFLDIANKIAPLGWHIVVYFEAADLQELIPFLKQLPSIVVVDHLGRPDVAKGVENPGFQRFVDFMQTHENIWAKVSCPERLTCVGPDYSDVVPFSKLLVERFPNRVLWGTDWPHPNMKSHMPDDGHLVDVIARIAVTKQLQQALLVDNPQRLYWHTEPARKAVREETHNG